ncbi:MAG: class I SAM-dependent methyltransferase, partial [Planctomycetota bacterium]
ALLRADVRQIPIAERSCAAVLVLFTAFGYFPDQDNQHTLQGLLRLLKPQGWLVIDLPNPCHVRATLVKESQRAMADGSLLLESRWLHDAYVCKRSRWHNAEGWQEREERVRLYEASEMAQMVHDSGGVIGSIESSLRGPQYDDHRQVFWIQPQCAAT